MSSSPTKRSLDLLRKDGWLAWVVEKWNPHARVRQDMWGFADVLCLRGKEILAVQATSDSNVAARVTKINNSKDVDIVREAGIQIHVHGWRKVKRRWQVRVVDCS